MLTQIGTEISDNLVLSQELKKTTEEHGHLLNDTHYKISLTNNKLDESIQKVTSMAKVIDLIYSIYSRMEYCFNSYYCAMMGVIGLIFINWLMAVVTSVYEMLNRWTSGCLDSLRSLINLFCFFGKIVKYILDIVKCILAFLGGLRKLDTQGNGQIIAAHAEDGRYETLTQPLVSPEFNQNVNFIPVDIFLIYLFSIL